MKQEHFMQALRRGLANLPKPEVDEIVADYREYISDAVAAGRNEEEVIAALGDPSKLARELKAQASYRQWESHRSFGNLMRVMIAIAGLGVMNFFLFFPFLIYMSFLTVGYVVSIALVIAGVVMVIGAGGNKLFNWPHVESLGSGNFSFDGHRGHTKLPGLSNSPVQPILHVGNNKDAPDVEGVTVEKDRFIFKLNDDEEANLVLANGTPVTLESDDGKVSVDTDDAKARALIVDQSDGSVVVARNDIQSIKVENSAGENFNYSVGKSPGETHLRFHSDDGDVSIDQDDKHNKDHFAATDGKNSFNLDTNQLSIKDDDGKQALSIDGNQISINDGDDHIHIGTRPGWSLIMTVLLFGIGFMIVGALGFWLCLWISRLTWRGLSRYVKYQISVVTGKEESLVRAE
jgi:hypothetical protein